MKLLVTLMLGMSALDALALNGSCWGGRGTNAVVFSLTGNQGNTRSGTASVAVGGREVARFDARDVRINYVVQSIRAQNAHGDLVQAQVTNLSRQTGVLSRLVVPAYGINISRLPVQCNLR
jgi:hypothetical protein